MNDSRYLKLDFGAHAGKPLSQVPVGYLRWMITALTHKPYLVAAAHEVLEERGQDIRAGDVVVTSHAIDRFSQRGGVELWRRDATHGEGIVRYLERLACEAREAYVTARGEVGSVERLRVTHAGLRWAWRVTDGIWVLITVLPAQPRRRGSDKAPDPTREVVVELHDGRTVVAPRKVRLDSNITVDGLLFRIIETHYEQHDGTVVGTAQARPAPVEMEFTTQTSGGVPDGR